VQESFVDSPQKYSMRVRSKFLVFKRNS